MTKNKFKNPKYIKYLEDLEKFKSKKGPFYVDGDSYCGGGCMGFRLGPFKTYEEALKRAEWESRGNNFAGVEGEPFICWSEKW